MDSYLFRLIARHAWCLGFFCITFDQLLVFKIHNFNFKISYFLFLFALFTLLVEHLTCGKIMEFLRESTRVIFSSPWIFILPIFIYSLLIARNTLLPTKAVMYTCWGFFDLGVVVLSGLWVLRDTIGFNLLFKYMAVALVFLSIIVIIDYFAHFYGYRAGLVGYNQGTGDWYINSRPHAFSYEPAYLALFFYLTLSFFFYEVFFSSRPILKPWISFLVLILGLCVILITFSRIVLIGLFCTAILFLSRLLVKRKISSAQISRIGGVIFLVLALFVIMTPKSQLAAVYDRMIYRLIAGLDSSYTSHVSGITTALEIAQKTKFLGVGAGNSYAYWYSYMRSDEGNHTLPAQMLGAQMIHNIWLEILAEIGFVGIICMIFFVVNFLRKLFSPQLNTRKEELLWLVFSTATIFFLVAAQGYPNFYRTDIWVWYTIWGSFFPNISSTST